MSAKKQEKSIQHCIRKASELLTDFGNPRTISAKEKARLRDSLQELGDFGVIVINEKNQVIAGNQRATILKEMEPEREIDCKILSGYSDEELKIINIRANKASGDFDNDILSEWIKEIKDKNIDLTGLSQDELEYILNGPIDIDGEWQGMPEFIQPNNEAFRTIIMHFESPKAVNKFAEIINQNITDKTKYLWFPKMKIDKVKNLRYKSES
jgi:hypothetical protein